MDFKWSRYHSDTFRGLSLEYKRMVQWDRPLISALCLIALTAPSSSASNDLRKWLQSMGFMGISRVLACFYMRFLGFVA